MNLQEADEVMQSDFWRGYINRLLKKKDALTHALCREGILEEKSWLKHVEYQGSLKILDWVLRQPDDMIEEAKGRLG